MKKNTKKYIAKALCPLALVMALSCGCTKAPAETEPTAEPTETIQPDTQPTEPAIVEQPGYLDAVNFGVGFAACGTGGRLDLIDLDGNITACPTGTDQTLRNIVAEGGKIAACGDKGTLILSEDGGASFASISPVSDGEITGVAMFRGVLFASGSNGMIYRRNGDGWDEFQMETNDDLISIVSSTRGICAVSADTDICFSEDGITWGYENFNEIYDGLYPTFVYRKLISGGETIFVMGYDVNRPDYPVIMYTGATELHDDVWIQRDMMKIDGEYVDETTSLSVNDLAFSADQIVAPMNDGVVLAITDCTECNETKTVEGADDLWAAATYDDAVLVCGENFFAQVFKSKQIRQDKIGAAKAKEDVVNGYAILIDVRETDELIENGFIPGSIHVPLAEVEERLPELVEFYDQEIIFYCASGGRSQKATELAVDMGFTSVYNLGGIKDWPYEIEFMTSEAG